ncbi:MAG: nucleotidyltransferase family protein [Rickettsiales bacterium]
MINQAIILSAGFGTRMLPITKKVPKPLIKINGISLLERIIKDLIESGVNKIVINTHHLADKIKDFIGSYQKTLKKVELHIIYEPDILETGGGIVNALHQFNNKPFFVVNCDVLIPREGKKTIYSLMSEKWDYDLMDALLLFHNKDTAVGYPGSGDFSVNENGEIIQGKENNYIFAGVHITKPKNFDGCDATYKKTMEIYKGLEFKRFSFVENPYDWIHVGTPESIKMAEVFLKRKNLI